MRTIMRKLFKFFYNVEVKGIENFKQAGDRVLIVANHL